MEYTYEFFVGKLSVDSLFKFPRELYDKHLDKLAYLYDTVKGIEDLDEAKRQFNTWLDHTDYVGIVHAGGNGVSGYLIAGGNQVIDMYVYPPFQNQGVGTQLLQNYKTFNEGKFPFFKAVWTKETVASTKVFVKCGFGVTAEFSPEQGCHIEALTPTDPTHYDKVLDNIDRSYIDFRGDYAVVDGHYTLEELEALIIVARRELK